MESKAFLLPEEGSPLSARVSTRLPKPHLAAACRQFFDLCRELGFALKLESGLTAVERLLPNFPGSPFRFESTFTCHLLKHQMQSGLYVDLRREALPTRERLQASRALYEHLDQIIKFTTTGHPDEIQSVVFLNISSGNFRLIQYWIDYPGPNDYAFRFVEDHLGTILVGLSQERSIDLTPWVRPISSILQPTLAELAVQPWRE